MNDGAGNDSAMRYIIRLDYAKTRGWNVRFFLKGRKGFFKTKLFSDGKFGGKEEALIAAKAWRDEQEVELKIHRYKRTDAPKAQIVNARNRSLATGIYLQYRKKDGQDHYANWEMVTMINGSVVTKTFSISRHGYQGAWKKALASRIKLTGQPVNATEPPEPDDRLKVWAKEHGIDLEF